MVPYAGEVTVGGDHKLHVEALVTKTYDKAVTGANKGLQLSETRYCPTFEINIISEATFLKKKCSVTKTHHNGRVWCVVRDAGGELVLRVPQHPTGLFVLDDESQPRDDIALLTRSYSEQHVLELYHRRFGHRNFSSVLAWLRHAGIPCRVPAKPPFCSACVLSRPRARATPSGKSRSTKTHRALDTCYTATTAAPCRCRVGPVRGGSA